MIAGADALGGPCRADSYLAPISGEYASCHPLSLRTVAHDGVAIRPLRSCCSACVLSGESDIIFDAMRMRLKYKGFRHLYARTTDGRPYGAATPNRAHPVGTSIARPCGARLKCTPIPGESAPSPILSS